MSGKFRCDRSGASDDRSELETEGYFNKAGMCGGWTGKTHDDISENVCRVQPDRRTDPDDKKYNGKPSVERKRPEYI